LLEKITSRDMIASQHIVIRKTVTLNYPIFAALEIDLRIGDHPSTRSPNMIPTRQAIIKRRLRTSVISNNKEKTPTIMRAVSDIYFFLGQK
jgi:hypothetical protein